MHSPSFVEIMGFQNDSSVNMLPLHFLHILIVFKLPQYLHKVLPLSLTYFCQLLRYLKRVITLPNITHFEEKNSRPDF